MKGGCFKIVICIFDVTYGRVLSVRDYHSTISPPLAMVLYIPTASYLGAKC
jgi:hypothetical protein